MSDTYIEKEPFGVGSIISNSFSVFFKNFFPIFTIAFLASVISVLINFLLLGKETTLGINPDPADAFTGYIAVSSIIQQIIFAFIVAVIVQLAYDARTEKPLRYSYYASVALKCVLPIFLLTLVISIAGGIGLVLLIVPGIWIFAVWSATTPAIVIENAGFKALGRSAELTKEYRWPIIGLFILVGLIVMVASVPLGLISAFLIGLNLFDPENMPSAASISTTDIILYTLLNSVGAAITYGFFCVVAALSYMRLREIKDGIGVDNVAEVFN